MTRSKIDSVSSLTTLPLLSSEDDLFRVLMGDGPRLDHLPAFLHEATHHWCSQRTLGVALATLAGEVVLGAHDLVELSKRDFEAAQTRSERLKATLLRYEAGKEILRPLSEGMALFAEFDIVSGTRSSVVSRLYTWMQSVFLALSPDDVTGLRSEVLAFQRGDLSQEDFQWQTHMKSAQALLNCRIQQGCVRRKTNVLLNPFSFVAGGYLPGYLTVKNLWWECSRKNWLVWEESDLFLTFLHAYVYDDPVLAHILIDPNRSAAEAARDFAAELSERLETIGGFMSKEALDRFQTAQMQSDAEGAQLSAIGRAENGTTALAAVRHRGEAFAEHQDSAEKSAMARALFASREVLYLGSLQCKADLQDQQANISLSGNEIRLPVHTESTHEPQGDGVKLFAVVGQVGAAVAAVISHHGRAQAVHWVLAPPTLAEEQTPRFLSGDLHLLGEQEVLSYARRVLETFEEVFAAPEMHDFSDGLARRLEEVYQPLALRHEEPGRREALARRMAGFGLQGLCGEVSVVRSLALLGLASAVRPSRSTLLRVYEALGSDLNAALDAARNHHGEIISLITLQAGSEEYFVLTP